MPHYRLLSSLPLVNPVVTVVPYCTGAVGKSIIPDGVVVSKVTIVFAAAKREASIVSAIQSPTIATAQPNAITTSVVDGIASNEIILWRLVAYSAAFSAVPVEIDAAARGLFNSIGEDVIISRAIHCNDLSAGTGNVKSVVANNVEAALSIKV